MTKGEIRRYLAERDGGDVCWWCKLPFGKRKHMLRTIDHLIPKALGGPDDLWNLCLAHLFCNSVRGADFFTTYRRVARTRPKRFRGGWNTPAAHALRVHVLEKEE